MTKTMMTALAALAAMTTTAAGAQQPQRTSGDRPGMVRDRSAQTGWNGDWGRDRGRSPTDQHGPGMDRRGPFGRGGPGMGIMRDPARLFSMMDTDRNGSISRTEFDRFHAQARSRMEQRMHDRSGSEGERFGRGVQADRQAPVRPGR
jgi:hypothetical protein